MPLLDQRWPTGQNDVGPLHGGCQRWPNSGMPLLGQRWPTGQNDVGPPVAANGGGTGGPTLGHWGRDIWETMLVREDLFQSCMSFVEDNLLTTNGGITHHGEHPVEDEELSPSLENLVVITWLRL